MLLSPHKIGSSQGGRERILLSEVRRWIAANRVDPARLEQWLMGDLPVGGTGEEPYIQLLEMVREGGSDVEEALVDAVTSILDSEPEKRQGDRQDTLVYNLLRLSAGLEARLAEPLTRMLIRQALDMSYNGMDLRHELRAALARNQNDSSLSTVWRAMLEGTDPGFLSGGVRDGFDGMVRMPEAVGQRARIEDIVYALDRLIPVLEKEYASDAEERDEELFGLLEEIRAVWAWPGLDEDLLSHAGCRWPKWVSKAVGTKQPETAAAAPSSELPISPTVEVVLQMVKDLLDPPHGFASEGAKWGMLHHNLARLSEESQASDRKHLDTLTKKVRQRALAHSNGS